MSRRQVQVDGDYCSRAPRVGLIILHNGNCGLFLKALTQGFRAERQKKNKQEASRVENKSARASIDIIELARSAACGVSFRDLLKSSLVTSRADTWASSNFISRLSAFATRLNHLLSRPISRVSS